MATVYSHVYACVFGVASGTASEAEEKGVDVRLAIDAMLAAVSGDYEVITWQQPTRT